MRTDHDQQFIDACIKVERAAEELEAARKAVLCDYALERDFRGALVFNPRKLATAQRHTARLATKARIAAMQKEPTA